MRHALLAALLVALCLPAGAAARVPRDFFGVMANGPLDEPSFALDAESSAMRSAGVQSERIEIAWDLVEAQKGPRPGPTRSGCARTAPRAARRRLCVEREARLVEWPVGHHAEEVARHARRRPGGQAQGDGRAARPA